MNSQESTKQKILLKLILIISFIVIICLPLIDQAFEIDPTILQNENRKLASFPVLEFTAKNIIKFPRKFEMYYNDNFGFRKTLLRLHILVKYYTLGAFSNPRVIFGKKDWLFYKDNQTLEYYRSIEPLNQEQIVRWSHVFRKRRDWLAEQGIKYLLIIVPIKHNVYPEYLPGNISRVSEESRLDQFLSYMNANSDLEILDLRPALLQAKNKNRVFHCTDTHWNEIGAFYAYEQIIKNMSKFFPEMEPLPLSEFDLQTDNIPGGDLACMLGINDLLYEENFRLIPRFPWKSHPLQLIGYSFLLKSIAEYYGIDDHLKDSNNGITGVQSLNNLSKNDKDILSLYDLNLYMVIGQQNSKLPKAVMFHDSYTVKSLFYFLSNHFNRIVFLWRDNKNPINAFEPELIKRERPTIVIQEMGERLFMKDPPNNPVKL